MSLSIIIPTYNREKILARVLKKLASQTIKPNKVIIIDDGSSFKSLKFLKQIINKLPNHIVLLNNFPQKGPASARNKGIQYSKEKIILFMNDDTIPVSNEFIEKHINFLKRFPNYAILGKLEWYPKTPNNFLKKFWTRKLGFDVGYKNNMIGSLLNYEKCCTANLLIQKKYLTNCLFNENFPFAAFEDIEWGYRLQKKGIFLRYNHQSAVFHCHQYNVKSIINRQKRVGISLNILLKLHPELHKRFKPILSKNCCHLLYKIITNKLLKYKIPPDIKYFLTGLVTKYQSYWGGS